VADYDPLTISDEELKALTPAERGAVYKARAAARAAGGAAPAPGAPAASGAPAPASPPAPGPKAAPAAAAAAGGPTTSGGTTVGGDAATAPTPAAKAAAAPAPSAAPATAAAAKAAPPPEPEQPKEPPFVQKILESVPGSSWQWRHGYAEVKVPREQLLDAARTLRSAGFDYLSFVTEVDWQDRLELVYHLFAYDFRAQPLGAILRCDLPREAMPEVASLTTIWPGAEFMEREAFEMMGIRFLGHPDLRRILLPDDFVGFPMRRDYETDFDYITVKQLVHETD
jgi:NADH-quinone oxidoreductase subunit C